MNLPRFRPEHRPASRGPIIVMNTGMTRQREGDWSIIQPDGSRHRWTREQGKAPS